LVPEKGAIFRMQGDQALPREKDGLPILALAKDNARRVTRWIIKVFPGDLPCLSVEGDDGSVFAADIEKDKFAVNER
jgi:hypothetical protein